MLYALACMVVLLLLNVCAVLSPRWNYNLSLILILASSLGFSLPTSASIGVRLIAAIPLLFVIGCRPYGCGSDTVLNALSYFSGLTFAMVIMPGLTHFNLSVVIPAVLGYILMLLVRAGHLRVPATAWPLDVLKILDVYILLSILCVIFFPAEGFGGSRLRGIAANANTLGFVLLVALAFAFGLLRSRRALVVHCLTYFSLALWTGSRTSLIGMLVIVLLHVWRSSQRRFATVAALIIATSAVLAIPGLSSGLLSGVSGRGFDSRSGTVSEAVLAFTTAPWTGLGFDGLTAEVASSPLRALAVGGVPMLLMLACIWVGLHRYGKALGGACFALTVGALVHSLGEGWMISTTGPLVLLFVYAFTGLAISSSGEQPTSDHLLAKETSAHAT